VIEGTDCSGKETQSKLLIENLHKRDNIEAEYMCYPRYDSPTGKIIGWPYLGKSYIVDDMIDEVEEKVLNNLHQDSRSVSEITLIKETLLEIKKCLEHGWFKEGANSVPPEVASLYYAADRKAHQGEIEYLLNQGVNVVIDRYAYSNSAHQGGKKTDKVERDKIYDWNYKLEFELLNLLPADLKVFLRMPTEYANLIKVLREEKMDEHEMNQEHLIHAERAYMEVAQKYDFETIECVNKTKDIPELSEIKSREEIGEEVYNIVRKKLILR
jgi:dTMP kinase